MWIATMLQSAEPTITVGVTAGGVGGVVIVLGQSAMRMWERHSKKRSTLDQAIIDKLDEIKKAVENVTTHIDRRFPT